MEDEIDTPTNRRTVLRGTGVALGALALGAGATASAAANTGPPGLPGRIYIDDELYATKDATDLPPPRGNNAHSYDEIYAFTDADPYETPAAGQVGVAEYAPGDREFNGGRWAVTLVGWTDGSSPTLVTNVDDLHANGDIEVVAEGARYFLCPVVRLHD